MLEPFKYCVLLKSLSVEKSILTQSGECWCTETTDGEESDTFKILHIGTRIV